MGSFIHFLLGFSTSFLGTLFPSMLNMTIVKISIKESQHKALFFAIGVSIVVVVQAYIAVGFSKILSNNPAYLVTLQKGGTIIFFGLSIFFLNQARINKKNKEKHQAKKVKGFISGLLLSSFNMFAIPFYFGVTSSLVMMGWYHFNMMNNLFFVLGSALGTFTLLFLYGRLAKKIEKKIERLANKMDLILGIVTGLIVIINLINFLL